MTSTSTSDAWLFDAYPHPRASKIVLWIKHGRMLRRMEPYHPEFCVAADGGRLERAQKLLEADRRVVSVRRGMRRLWLRGPEQEVLLVRTRRLQDIHGTATAFRRATHCRDFLLFDVDHAPESRFLHERGLSFLCRLHVGPHGPELRLADGEDRWMYDYPDPPLATTKLGLEVAEQGHERSFDDPLVLVRLDDEVFRVETPGDAASERRTLIAFGKHLQCLDPDVILTRHGDRFDVPYLLHRIQAHKLDIRLGRGPDPIRPSQEGKSLHTYGRWLFKSAAYYLRGRWHIDLAKKALDSEDDRDDLHGITYVSRIANRRPQDVNRNGAGYALQQMQIDAASDMGVALPWKRNLAEDWKDAATLCAVDRGGQIMVPKPGIVEDVAACDFSGYYPSIVVAHNLSSDTINCRCCPDGPVVPELGYHVCQQVVGHQAGVLRKLVEHRRLVKAVLKRHGDTKARAIKSELKALGVVCFGYFRYRNARYGCAEVHQAIQCLGRDGMTRARTVAAAQGYEMVHAMTDCVFLHKPGVIRTDARRIARAITHDVGVPMDVEGVYKWVVFLPSKTHSTTGPATVGVPNRYYGKFEDGTLKVRGIEVQRHSTPPWLYDVQQGMLDELVKADTAAQFTSRIPAALDVAKRAADALCAHRVKPEDLGIMVQATMAVEDYAANTATKAALLRLRDAGTERKPGEYVRYVITRRDGPAAGRAVPVELLADGPFQGGVRYDVDAYLRLLSRSVETLLSPFGHSEDSVYAWLTGRAAVSARQETL